MIAPPAIAEESTLPASAELAVGRFYIDGEPEVRVRRAAVQAAQADELLLVVTLMGDDERPVGVTASVFAVPAHLSAQAAEALVLQNVATRVAASNGSVLHQEVRRIGKPSAIERFLVVELLRSAERLAAQPQ